MKKAEYKGYVYYVTEDGKHLYNSKGKERIIEINYNRQNRRHLSLSGKDYFLNILVANAFPEICGELFEGCVVHHIDGDPTNDAANNLRVMSSKEHIKLHCGLIVKYTMTGERLGEYTTSQEAANSINNIVTAAAIRECLCGNSKYSGGFIWKREF